MSLAFSTQPLCTTIPVSATNYYYYYYYYERYLYSRSSQVALQLRNGGTNAVKQLRDVKQELI